MSAAPCSNVPVYHHCDYVRWLGWPLHHGRLKCGPRVPLDEILALNPSYKHCLPREGFFLFLPLSLSSHFFAFSYSFKRPYSLDHSFCLLQLFFVIFASVWCGTGISKAKTSPQVPHYIKGKYKGHATRSKCYFLLKWLFTIYSWKETKIYYICEHVFTRQMFHYIQ